MHNQLKAGVILSFGSMILGCIISIFYMPIMLRFLGQSEYGVYNLVSSVVSYLSLLSFGFGSAYIRYFSRYQVQQKQENIAKLNAMLFIIYSVIGFLCIVLGGVLIFNIDFILGKKLIARELATAKTLMIILVINMSISFPFSVFNSYITVKEEYIFQKLMQLIITVANPFIMVPVLVIGYKSVGMGMVYTVLTLVVEIGNVVFCFKKLKMKFLFQGFDFKLMKEMVIFSSYIFLNMIVDQINWNVDKVILGRVRGSIAVAVYGLAAQLNAYYLSLSNTISSVFVPKVNAMVALANDNEELSGLFTRIGRIQFMLLSFICSALIFFGKPFIRMWAGANYSDAYFITLLLIVPVTIPLIQSLGIEIQRAKNMHQFYSRVCMLIALGKVCLSILFAKLFGGIGAAMGTAISLLIGNGLIMNWYYDRRVGLNMKYFWCQILKFLPSFLPTFLMGLVMYWFVDLYHIISFFVCGMIYTVTFFVFLWIFGMNQYEKDLIRKAGIYLRGKLFYRR